MQTNRKLQHLTDKELLEYKKLFLSKKEKCGRFENKKVYGMDRKLQVT